MEDMLIKRFSFFDISEITLLSIEEYEKCRGAVPDVFVRWWLRDAGYSYLYAASVKTNGDVDRTGTQISHQCFIRPAFKINTVDLNVGDKVIVGHIVCTVVGSGYVLSDNVIEKTPFTEKSYNGWLSIDNLMRRYINSPAFRYKIGL